MLCAGNCRYDASAKGASLTAMGCLGQLQSRILQTTVKYAKGLFLGMECSARSVQAATAVADGAAACIMLRSQAVYMGKQGRVVAVRAVQMSRSVRVSE